MILSISWILIIISLTIFNTRYGLYMHKHRIKLYKRDKCVAQYLNLLNTNIRNVEDYKNRAEMLDTLLNQLRHRLDLLKEQNDKLIELIKSKDEQILFLTEVIKSDIDESDLKEKELSESEIEMDGDDVVV